MWWANTLRTSAEDLGTLAENEPPTGARDEGTQKTASSMKQSGGHQESSARKETLQHRRQWWTVKLTRALPLHDDDDDDDDDDLDDEDENTARVHAERLAEIMRQQADLRHIDEARENARVARSMKQQRLDAQELDATELLMMLRRLSQT